MSTTTYAATMGLSCSVGDSLSGSTCTHSTTYAATASYSCPSGGSLSGSTCIHTDYVAASVSDSCPSGYTLSGSTCSATSSTAATASYSCNGLSSDGAGSCLGGTLAYSYYEAWDACLLDGDYYGLTLNSVTQVSGRRYDCTYQANVTYSCPSGGTLSGNQCVSSSSEPATANYSCSAGTLSGSTCLDTTVYTATASYSCPNGGTLSGSQCVGTVTTGTAYVYLNGKQIAEAVVNGATQYVHTDVLGSPVAHSDQAGYMLSRTKFEPYGYTAAGTKPGPALGSPATTGSAIGFTGHVNDPDTDLVYMQQRYYDPVAGRFLSVDPVVADADNGGAFNRYAYANNSPYKYVDPDGREIRIVGTKEFMPTIFDGGCNVIRIRYSRAKRQIKRIECNGDA